MGEQDITERLQAYDCFLRETIRDQTVERDRFRGDYGSDSVHTSRAIQARIEVYQSAQAALYKFFPELKRAEKTPETQPKTR